MSEAIDITDDTENNRFVYRENGLEAELTYRAKGDHLALVHTGVPEALGGRGIAGALVQAAVDRAASSGETVAPWCPYARKWLEGHGDEASRISIDWAPPPQR